MKYEFGGAQWLAALHGILCERAAQVAKIDPEVQLSMCEIYTGAPVHLAPGADGRICWGARIKGANVEFLHEQIADASFTVTGDWEAMLPMIRYDTCGDPERIKEMTSMNHVLMITGKLKVTGRRDPRGKAFPSVHDAIARLTD